MANVRITYDNAEKVRCAEGHEYDGVRVRKGQSRRRYCKRCEVARNQRVSAEARPDGYQSTHHERTQA